MQPATKPALRLRRKNLKRNNHFLPECYQRGFTDSSGKLWIKPQGKEPKYRNPSAGRRRSLYIVEIDGVAHDDIEDFFDRSVEAPFAQLSQRIKEEQHQFRNMSAIERGVLCRFVASQAVRTIAQWNCMSVQAGAPVDSRTFLRNMLRLIKTITMAWTDNPPVVDFYTVLPHIGEQFITGDHPVLVIRLTDNSVWVPSSAPELKITNIKDLLADDSCRFWLALSPYVYASIRMLAGGKAQLPPATVDPQFVRLFNGLIRGQCSLFTVAKDRNFLI
jgi:Protein of unknown function (DUF4238)